MARICVFGPHPDDQELGMGGTVARLADQGHDVLLVDMTDGSPTPHGTRETRLVEAEASRKVLCPPGTDRVRRLLLDLKNREVQHTIEARHRVAGVIRAHQATILFIPHPQDAHPDHLAVTRICEDARFDAKLTKVQMPVPSGYREIGPPIYPKWVFYYYCSHLRRPADPTFILDITGYEDRKLAAIQAYQTQFAMNPITKDIPDKLRMMWGYFGWMIGTHAAEPFWCREPIGLSGLSELA